MLEVASLVAVHMQDDDATDPLLDSYQQYRR
jgi:hypothetical protein